MYSEHSQFLTQRVSLNDLQDGPKNALYTSHGIQDELLHILAKNVRKRICEELKTAGYYSIIVDESKDLAKKEQMSFVVRYFNLNDRKIHERFLSFSQAKCLDAASLSEYIKSFMTEFDFDPKKLVSQGYDGASIMSGPVHRCTSSSKRILSICCLHSLPCSYLELGLG